MEPPLPPATEPDTTPRPQPGDGEGPNRLRDGLSDARKGNRSPKCDNCGRRHAGACKDGTQPPARPSNAPPATPIFTPANTGRLLRVPFTVAAVRTHCAVWLLSPEEEAELTASAVPFLNEWVAIDPKYAALFMFSWSLGSIALGKAMGYSAWTHAMRAQAEEAAKARKAPPEQALPKDSGPAAFAPTPTPPMPGMA